MSLLKEAILELREPLVEGKGIKVFPLNEYGLRDHYDTMSGGGKTCPKCGKKSLTRVKDGSATKNWYCPCGAKVRPSELKEDKGFAIDRKSGKSCNEIHKEIAGFMKHAKTGKVFECGKCHKKFTVGQTNEGWGWEDVWADMIEDQSIQELYSLLSRQLDRGVPLDRIASNMEDYEAEAETELTPEERTVMLKVLSKEHGEGPGLKEAQTQNSGPSKAWRDFNKAASTLVNALRTVSIESGTDERPSNALNFEIVNDINHTVTRIQEQLDRLDRRYDWRDYMSKNVNVCLVLSNFPTITRKLHPC